MELFRKHVNSFDSQAWKVDENRRNCYVTYILKSKMTMGKTKEDIKNLFGEEGNYSPFDRWTYFIGKGFLWRKYLVFYFKEGKVDKVKVELSK